MSYTEDLFNQAKSKMLSDFKKAITDAEALRKAAPDLAGDGAAAVPTNPEGKLGGASATPEEAYRACDGEAAETTATADGRVHDGS